MKAARQVALAIYSLCLVAFAALLIVLAWDDQTQLDIDLGGFRLVSFVDAGSLERWLFTGLMVLVAWLGILTLVLAVVRQGRPVRDRIMVTRPDGVRLEVTAAAAAGAVRSEVEMLPDVAGADAAAYFMDDAAHIAVDLTPQPWARLEHVPAAVNAAATRVLGERFNIPLGAPVDLRIQPAEGAAGYVRDRQPLPPRHPEDVPPPPRNLRFPADDGG